MSTGDIAAPERRTPTPAELKAAIDPPLHRSVPQDIHPAVVTSDLKATLVDGVDSIAAPAFNSAETAAKHMYTAAAALRDAKSALVEKSERCKVMGANGIEFTIPPERHAEAQTIMSGALRRAATVQESALERIDSATADLNSRVERLLSDPKRNENSRAANLVEVRQIIRELPPQSRLNFILTKISEGEKDVSDAVLHGSALTSGLTKQDQAKVREYAAATFAKREVDQLAGLAKLRERVQVAGRALLGVYTDVVPRANAAEVAAKAALGKLAEVGA